MTLWINDLTGVFVSKISMASNGNFAGRLIVLSDKIYLGGYDDQGKATLWISDLKGNLLNKIELDNGQVNSLALSSTAIYSTGQDDLENAVLWICDLDGNNIKKNILAPQGAVAIGVAL